MVGAGAQVIVGASGGIGRALVEALLARRPAGPVYAFSRTQAEAPANAVAGRIDLTDEASIAAAAAIIAEPIDLVIVASGVLHGEGLKPERSYAALDAERLKQIFAVNAVGPALVAKHFLPRFPKEGRAIFAALSARVGSIEDNRLGGWYGYRASKAALNMLIRSLAIELRRTRANALCVALHPGTVDTGLSRPFQRNVAPTKLFSVQDSASRLLDVIDELKPDQNGGFFAYDGSKIPF